MLRRFLVLAALVPLSLSAQTPAGTSSAIFPDTPVGLAMRQWLDAFNSGDSTQLGAFYRKYGMQRSLEAQMRFRAQTGGFELVSIETDEPRLLEFVVRERNSGTHSVAVSELSPDETPRMVQSALAAVPPGRSVADFRIDAAARTQVVEGAIAKLDENYVFPEIAKKMADTVRARLRRGAYDRISNGLTFASTLTQHFQEVSRDKHLRVNFVPAGVPQRRPSPSAERQARRTSDPERCGFLRSEKLDGNVGYVKFNFFASPDECGDVATEFITRVTDADALIIDLRDNGGGDPAMVAHISSYLFSKRTHLNDIWERPGNKTGNFYTNPALAGRKLGDDKPVYVLTSNRTFSGAEEFSYNLKNLKRATIVGETTGGGAHPVNGHRIHDKFMIGVPFARAINPITKTNWEGTGVEPDVKVSASNALDVAKKLIADKRVTP
ncbi:MAG: S41 family peptidase [Gemmatimonadaceae bacterium]